MSKNANPGQTSPSADNIPEFQPGDIVEDPPGNTKYAPTLPPKDDNDGEDYYCNPNKERPDEPATLQEIAAAQEELKGYVITAMTDHRITNQKFEEIKGQFSKITNWMAVRFPFIFRTKFFF